MTENITPKHSNVNEAEESPGLKKDESPKPQVENFTSNSENIDKKKEGEASETSSDTSQQKNECSDKKNEEKVDQDNKIEAYNLELEKKLETQDVDLTSSDKVSNEAQKSLPSMNGSSEGSPTSNTNLQSAQEVVSQHATKDVNKSNNIEFRSTAIGISLPKPIPIGESESNAILKKYPQTSSTHNYETDQELTLSSANRKSSRKVSVKMEVTEVSYAEVGIKTLEGEESSRKI